MLSLKSLILPYPPSLSSLAVQNDFLMQSIIHLDYFHLHPLVPCLRVVYVVCSVPNKCCQNITLLKFMTCYIYMQEALVVFVNCDFLDAFLCL